MMKRKPKAGFLPCYLPLYDETIPELRPQFDPLLQTVKDELYNKNIDIVSASVCRIDSEFREAIEQFENAGVDIIITLHLAYSLSLEAIEALARTSKPILLLDTTMDFCFDQNVDPQRIMFNHGIHGVQDLASMLRRRGVSFHIVAGHVNRSMVLHRAAEIVRGAYAASCLQEMKVLRIGESFSGMGDFAVDDTLLQDSFSIKVDTITPDQLADDIDSISSDAIDNEMQLDLMQYQTDIADEVHRRSVRVGLGVRRYLERGGYGAFSINFLAFNSSEEPVDTVPFLEISKAMSRDVGYAGEGDVLTASLVGALSQAFGKTTFTEAFCPDWENGALFMSHMGEMNPAVAGDKPLLCEKDFPWSGALNPAILACAPTPGAGILVNLAPGQNNSFGLIIAPVDIMKDTTNPVLKKTIRGWIRPNAPLEWFLENYSLNGGTHHSALMLGDHTEAIAAFASFIGLERVILKND